MRYGHWRAPVEVNARGGKRAASANPVAQCVGHEQVVGRLPAEIRTQAHDPETINTLKGG